MSYKFAGAGRRLGCVLLAAVLLLSLALAGMGPACAQAAGGGVTVKLHYHRPDGAYDGWYVWFWAEGKDGAGYPFAEEDGDMVATFVAEPGVTSIGYIVRTASWDKDIAEDQFIDISDVVSGTIHVYVESGVAGYTRENGGDAVTGVKVSSVKYDRDAGTVVVTTSGTLPGDPASAFTLTEAGGEKIGIQSAEKTGDKVYTLTPAAALDGNKSYQLEYDGTAYDVIMPILYSTEEFEAEYTYDGDDLGAVWTEEGTTFRVWAPTASAVSVDLYTGGEAGKDDLIERVPMTAGENGTWTAEKEGDLNGVYYTYEVTLGGQVHEACDPYARATGVNGQRAMVIDLDSTDPEGWDADTNPNAGGTYNDAVIYELHVRDASIDESSGITNKGKYLGLAETGTKTPGGAATGLDHIKELGATHVHLLPVYDFGSIDETKLDTPQFNWGYDPVNYNVPEGSYSTDPYHGEVRVAEMKQMIKAMHDNGLSVVMDVVYNHVQSAENFCFNQIVPGYFSRVSDTGVYSNGSGCGNDTASERSMVSKYIVDSVNYWADEYHMDGFRFDLVGLLDIDTINEIVETVHAKHPDVIFYGEGWSMTTAVTKDDVIMATQPSSGRTPGFAFFSDNIRDALKGSVFDRAPGFVSGATGKATIMSQLFYGLNSWCKTPAQSVNYASCHDNNTLIDRITLSTPNADRADQVKMNNLAAAFYLTAEGIPFMQAGEEMLRTKVNPDGTFNENSYNASDEVNAIKWSDLDEAEYDSVFQYYKGLIAFRKAHGALRLTTAEDVKAHITTIEDLPENVVALQISGGINGETADAIFAVFNPNNGSESVTLPEGDWDVYIDGECAGTEVLNTVSGTVQVAPISALVLTRASAPAPGAPEESAPPTAAPEAPPAPGNGGMIAAIIAVVVVIIAVIVGVVVYNKKKKTSDR